MTNAVSERRFTQRPSTLGFMLRAFHRAPGLGPQTRFPPVRARWLGQRADDAHFARFAELTGLRRDSAGAGLLYPQVLGFPLQMVVLTDPELPVPIWRALQIRNHLVQHRPIAGTDELDWETRVSDQRMLSKGAEIDLRTELRSRGELVWEGTTVIYYRGPAQGDDAASKLATPPTVSSREIDSWHMPGGVGWRFAGLTGDFNGIHLWDWYARRFGFRRALHHPQLVVGQCLARLPEPGELPRRLDLWLKGPVFYGSDVRLLAEPGADNTAFSLRAADEDRPALIGRMTSVDTLAA